MKGPGNGHCHFSSHPCQRLVTFRGQRHRKRVLYVQVEHPEGTEARRPRTPVHAEGQEQKEAASTPFFKQVKINSYQLL